jgi:oxygen-dependent protoporphyrinogen oxidase
MSPSRRDFLKFVVAGSAAGCPIDLSLLAKPETAMMVDAAQKGAAPRVDGEHYEVCHEVRDGHAFGRPPVSKRHDVVIVGGGVSGLSAAYSLRQHDFLLLEKELHWGGNAYLEEYEGQAFATGSAFDIKGSASEQLAREIGLTLLPIDSPDPTIVNGKWVKDTWREGLDELPYSSSVRESFKRFRKEMLGLDIEKDPEQFDSVPLSKYLVGYAPEIKKWWDAYGSSNWGAKSSDASALVAISEFKEMATDKQDARVTLPGGNGALSRRLGQTLAAKHGEQMIAGVTVIAVEPQREEVRITYVHEGQLRAAAAKFVVMATPKFITLRIVTGLSSGQSRAMKSLRYCPYPVINMIFDGPLYNRAYDTWCPGNAFTDFIVADWVLQKQPGYHQKKNILTFYTPIAELDRTKLLAEEGCRQIAVDVLRDFRALLPEFNVSPIEIHLYRRGHPMFLPTPGTFTKQIPAASRPLERVFFANTDSTGPVSDVSGAVQASRRAAEWVEARMTGASLSAAGGTAASTK